MTENTTISQIAMKRKYLAKLVQQLVNRSLMEGLRSTLTNKPWRMVVNEKIELTFSKQLIVFFFAVWLLPSCLEVQIVFAL